MKSQREPRLPPAPAADAHEVDRYNLHVSSYFSQFIFTGLGNIDFYSKIIIQALQYVINSKPRYGFLKSHIEQVSVTTLIFSQKCFTERFEFFVKTFGNDFTKPRSTLGVHSPA